jgi:hypothetical protein
MIRGGSYVFFWFSFFFSSSDLKFGGRAGATGRNPRQSFVGYRSLGLDDGVSDVSFPLTEGGEGKPLI